MFTELSYHIIRSNKRKKTISLSVQRNGEISIHVPCKTPDSLIDKFFEDKKPWISKKLSEKKELLLQSKQFFDGEHFLYLGESYTLEIQDAIYTAYPLEYAQNRFILNKSYKNSAKELFILWYKKKANENITERVKFFSQKLQLFPKAVKITNAEYRWGSCSSKNVLSFTWRLIMAPYPAIDYVIVHELLHMKERNHSGRFWSLIETHMPDFRKHKTWLKDNANLLSFR